jgi:hypothetical protein
VPRNGSPRKTYRKGSPKRTQPPQQGAVIGVVISAASPRAHGGVGKGSGARPRVKSGARSRAVVAVSGSSTGALVSAKGVTKGASSGERKKPSSKKAIGASKSRGALGKPTQANAVSTSARKKSTKKKAKNVA